MSVLEQFSLQGRVALVTGAGRGLGRAMAVAFAEAGASVICAARTAADVETSAELCNATAGQGLAAICDVGNADQREAAVKLATERFGRLDVLVNNAGGAYPNDPLNTSTADFDRDFHFNVTTALAMSQLCLPQLREHQGSIINISSAAARYAQAGFSSYSTVKAALSQLTRSLAADFAPAVRVNGIAPGSILTDALGQFLDQETQQKMADLTPMKRLGRAEDIAAAALYLASPAAAWVTGKILEIDGGAEASTWPF
ncbi:glucose 1-dehydrogenase [Spongiibacter nanhainus]|uniref:Glucose 1-dehydrogenase n=1 Tax=Spongiibacter nanhainus TaxID=2794344 RepID=A0A7T4QZH3_9GAMM|nr:glucose 1-dehydrogenase [Spongiibacter nanhainus]QQD17596.1 glucose 1-dehydrogenase [Spongiibacter nanhainus]